MPVNQVVRLHKPSATIRGSHETSTKALRFFQSCLELQCPNLVIQFTDRILHHSPVEEHRPLDRNQVHIPRTSSVACNPCLLLTQSLGTYSKAESGLFSSQTPELASSEVRPSMGKGVSC